jgi:hypothetical protein
MDNQHEKRIKHLEFIQLTITRMNVNSFLVKGWLVTIVAAVFILSQKDANAKYLWFAPFATLIFWALDGYFIMIERQYRSLYDWVRVLTEDKIDFSMSTTEFQGGRNSFVRGMFSITLVLFYFVVFIASILAAACIPS